MIVEDGTGLPNSNSYVSIAEADQYCDDRALSDWSDASDNEKTPALIRATDYIDANYIFRSVPLTDDQALANPRYGDTALNAKVKAATIALAVIALSTDLTAPPARGIASKEVTADSVSTKTTFDPAFPTNADPYPSITKLLKGFATRAAAGVQIGMMTR